MRNLLDVLSKVIAINFILFGIASAFHILYGLFQGTLILNPGIFLLYIGYSLFKDVPKGISESLGATRMGIFIVLFFVFVLWHDSEIIVNGMIISDSTRYALIAFLFLVIAQSIFQYIILFKKMGDNCQTSSK